LCSVLGILATSRPHSVLTIIPKQPRNKPRFDLSNISTFLILGVNDVSSSASRWVVTEKDISPKCKVKCFSLISNIFMFNEIMKNLKLWSSKLHSCSYLPNVLLFAVFPDSSVISWLCFRNTMATVVKFALSCWKGESYFISLFYLFLRALSAISARGYKKSQLPFVLFEFSLLIILLLLSNKLCFRCLLYITREYFFFIIVSLCFYHSIFMF
jgi:hypothetical protein